MVNHLLCSMCGKPFHSIKHLHECEKIPFYRAFFINFSLLYPRMKDFLHEWYFSFLNRRAERIILKIIKRLVKCQKSPVTDLKITYLKN